MHVESIHTYPIKSCRRVTHESVRVEPWGLAGDRRWMVVDEDGRCVTQREVPAMTGIHPMSQPDGGLVLRARGDANPAVPDLSVPDLSVPDLSVPDLSVPDLSVPLPVPGDVATTEVKVHSTTVAALSGGPAADAWLTSLLGRKVRLVWLDDPTRRVVKEAALTTPHDRVSFADAYPLLLTNAASLAMLNDWIAEGDGAGEGPLPMDRFRPNVVVSGAQAWAEDGWLGRRLQIGPVTFRAVKACDRCVMTTTDQDSGERGKEPLRTLARYRKAGQKLLFGTNLVPDSPVHKLTVGDEVTLVP